MTTMTESLVSSTVEMTTVFDNTSVTYYNLLKQPLHMIVIYSCVYSAVFLFALCGNLMVITVVVRNRSMHNATNYFIVNLAIADVLVSIFCVPITLLSNLYTGWQFGEFTCRVTPYLQGVSVSASVNTLVAIAVDRYLAICRTLEFKLESKTCKSIIVCIWVVSLAIMVPWAVFYDIAEFKTSLQVVPICIQRWPSPVAKKAYVIGALFLCCYAIPLVLICVFYLLIALRVWNREPPGAKNSSSYIIHRSRVKVVKMIAVVVIMFAVSWLPLYAVNLKLILYGVEDHETQIMSEIVIPFAQWLGSSNSVMNPIVYCFFSRKFRDGFKDVITCFRFRSRSSSHYVRPSINMKYHNHKQSPSHRTHSSLCPSPDRSYTNSDTFV
ncbi:neuropeptide SIFamide receptor-like [Mizuhopecten yessoensis]|uniref:neuropeptide SIFamide receptor-like n=1 Tax=Mizuhopecten yessoensis TaxID=6573 RepID=UPI000B45ABDC|nr:neuropeptide SIFamide receptor-like [Mizuhopecten yessoensis]